jgi:integrase
VNAKVRGVYENPKGSGVWWIHYFAYGKRHREKIGAHSLAIEAYFRRKTEIREGRFTPASVGRAKLTFNHLVTDTLEYSKQHHSELTRDGLDRTLETILTWFEGRPPMGITPQEIDRQLALLTIAGKKPATVNRYRSALSLVFSLAVKNGKVPANPCRHVPTLTENNARVRFLEEEEEDAIRGNIQKLCPQRELEFDLALHTGMRQAEMYSLRWEDVDLKRNVITIPRSKHGEKRHIPINSVARAAFAILSTRRDASGRVIPLLRETARKNRGDRVRYYPRWFEDIVTAAGVKNFRWHDLRHTFASRLVMAGVNVRTVQELMGHRAYEMTLRYAHLSDRHLRAAIECLTEKATPAPVPRGEPEPDEQPKRKETIQ